MWKELCVESVLQLRQSLLLILVSMITKVDIENFIEVPIHLPSDGSLIQILLTSHNLEIDQLILYFLTNHDYSLMISFINRIQHYPEAIPAFIQAPGFLEILKLGMSKFNFELTLLQYH